MAYKGYDTFHTKPDEEDEMFCKVCGTRCLVERSVTDPSNLWEELEKRGHWHDEFTCPNSEASWHISAFELLQLLESTPSRRLAEIYRLDLLDLLCENGCVPGVDWLK
jgi:hypothetical protein